ncbi:MAG: isoprenylcysteine carboxylmethyltransferase family protein [Deltaproteobacteria bacterium]|nr:isoprenylcysteine carboxylmethyltransferase family protein [Deltaproteobacteria bacterium]MBW2138140.1 isoprenylcysteine carboxylmethyltransferase family protein [Deltaproteobacteria bacterium]
MEKRLTKGGVRALLAPFWWTIVMAIAFFLAAGRLDLLRAWVFFGIYLAGAVVGALIMWRFAPGLANQRAFVKQGTKTWDKAFLAIYFPISLVVFPIVAGLDVGRYRWSQLDTTYAIIGVILYLACFVLGCWAMVVNEHFEATVRIQTDRGHKVITSGPYRFVRHPGYLSMILGGLSACFVLGSAYSLIPAAVSVAAVVVRTHLEDRTLQGELTGYSEYVKQTPHRLIPGIW